MPTAVLIDTTNRLLGWSTGDFSQYGAQPAITIGTPRVATDPTLLSVPSATTPPANPASAAAFQVRPAAPSTDDSAYPAIPEASPEVALSQLHVPVSDTASLAPQIASPTESGLTAPIVPDTALPAAIAQPNDTQAAALTEGHSAASLAAPGFAAAEAASAGFSALAPPILALAAPALAVPADTVGGVVVALTPTANILGANTQLLDGVTHQSELPAVQATVGGIAATLPDTPALADTAAGSVAGVADVASAALDDVGTAAANVATTAATTVTAHADTFADIAAERTANTATPAATLTAPALPDDHLGGTDPAGGVTTLVSMVETADLFEVTPSAADAPAIGTGGSIVDTLAADALPDALLGDAHHSDDTPIPDHVDHGGLGL